MHPGGKSLKLHAAQIRYLGIAHVVISILINAVVCATIGLVDYRDMPLIPVWGLPKSMALDLIATSFLLPAITCMIATPLTRRDVSRGTVDRIDRPPPWLARLPTSLPMRAFVFGIAGLITMGALLSWILSSQLAVGEVQSEKFIVAKVMFACCYGAIVTPTVAIIAMSEAGFSEENSGLPCPPPEWESRQTPTEANNDN